ncbi:PAS domain-containing protein [Helicobacter sp. 11S02629-2]|uniref:PAS domain-containing protein n=1 Tax=Helicobacter sp. 11S02629-2 TaxID=1476195 RepID=UPI000BA501A6|nr:PAS domain-containing protein [Helicobacter sp. 11S02629-2]PAF45676.1 PAS sensor protein [Helicobacter sp. 11S02629-2]
MGEKILDSESFIVSKTDLKGNITYCNQVFLKMINAKNSEVINKPQSIVRHKDMPRGIFKLLWDRIKAKQEVFAYVKNKTFDGNYYWVFANVTASVDESGKIIGYYSVRRKANPLALNAIESLYRGMKDVEKRSSLEASMRFLDEYLKQKDVSYDALVNSLQRMRG